MSTNQLRPGSLILYKNRPGRVTRVGPKKVEITLEDGATQSVRPKDVTLLHPGPAPALSALRSRPGEIKVAWELLAGQTTTLAELAELAYGDYTPDTAWAAWEYVADGLYFSGEPDALAVHRPEEVAAETEARAAKVAAAQAWEAFLERLRAGRYDPALDESELADVVDLAFGRREQSRVLAALGRSETPEEAHALLLEIGYWDETVDPYPVRAQLPTHEPAVPLPPLPDEARRDLTGLVAVAIDDALTSDPDDALSIDGERLWVHVADVAALVPPDSPADLEARARTANLYLPEGTVHMLPPAATQQLALGVDEVSPALSLGIDFDPAGGVAGLDVVPSWIRVTRLTYAAAEKRLEEEPLRQLYALARRHMARREANGAINIDLPEVKVRVAEGAVDIQPLPNLRSRDLVREAMLAAGEAVARLAQETGLPVPYSTQEPPEVDPAEFDDSPAGMYALRRQMRRSQQKSTPAPHAGLGMALYTQATSPLRRYLDLVVHQQLRAYIKGEQPLDEQAVMERVGALEATISSARWAERRAIEHWTLVYLRRFPQWQGQGIVVEKRGMRHVVLIPELALEAEVYLRREYPLNATLTLAVSGVDLPQLTARLRVLEGNGGE